MIEYTDSAKIDVLKQALIDNRYTDVIDRLRPNSKISINPSQKGFIDIYLQYPNDFIDSLREAIYRVRTQKDGDLELIRSSFDKIKINLIGELLMNMHDINTKHENTTVTLEAKFDCPLCGNEYDEKCTIDRTIIVPTCHNTSCKKVKTLIRTSEMVTDDIQTILMQEPMDKSKKSSPVIFTGKLVGKLDRFI